MRLVRLTRNGPMAALRSSPRRRSIGGSRSAWRCALAISAAIAASWGMVFLSPSSGRAQPGGAARLKAKRDGIEDIFGDVQKSAEGVQKQAAELSPDRLQAKAAEALEGLTTDDGRVLDASAPAGAVGAIAVGLAVLPYMPISLYSSYTLATTGKGLDAGPNGVYGLAEGFATLVVLSTTLWSTVSFVTRARGLPAGPFNLLAITQAFAYLSTLALAGALFLNSGSPSENPMRGLPAATDKFNKEVLKNPTNAILDATEGPRTIVGDVAKVATAEAGKALGSAYNTASKAVSESKVPSIAVPDIQIPDMKVPNIQIPDIKVPDIKAPDLKVPDIKMPDFKLPKITVPEFKKVGEGLAKDPVPMPVSPKQGTSAQVAAAPKEATPVKTAPTAGEYQDLIEE